MRKISSIELENICCFKKISLDFRKFDKVADIAVLLGNNGTGKTTILRSIALGLNDSSSSAGLIQELYGDLIREGENKGVIRIRLAEKTLQKEPLFLETTLRNLPSGKVEVKQELKPKQNFPWDDIFICGYGAARGTFGSEDIREYSSVDSVITLFNYSAKLQNAELILRRIMNVGKDSNGVLKKILNRIDNILILPKGSTELGKSGITVGGPWGEFMPHGSLGDGYRAMLALISDMLGWALFYDEKMFYKEIEGIVLIDEVEQHLHPDWQRKIIRLLNEQFPKIQFIFSTHSPLIAANSSNLLKDQVNSKLFHLNRDNSLVVSSEIEENLGELDFDQILSSEAFGYMLNINPEIEYILREASTLAAKDAPTLNEKKRLQHFKNVLRKVMFPEGRSLIERVVEREYYTELEKKVDALKKSLEE